MHIPLLSALAAKKRWCGGAPALTTPDDLRQAQADAPYWANELRAGNIPAFDVHTRKVQSANEAYHLEHFRFLSFIHHQGFWNALVDHLGTQSASFWMPAIDAAIESGNVHALAALGTRGGYPLQTLFFEWSACTNDGKGNGWLHPRSLEWFANDASLHDPLRAMSESFFHRDYSAALFTANIPLWWDAPNALGGADAILSMTKQWCALDAGMTSTEKGVQSALVLLAALNKRDSERVRHDPVGAPRNHLAVRTLVGALEQSVDVLCARFDIPIALMRTLAGRMTMQDMENPVLCAVAHHDTDHFNDDVPAFPQYKAPLGAAQRMQIAHNASFAEPLPTLLDMQGWSGNPWVMYCLAEPFVKQRPVATLALPDNVLDAPPW